MLRVRSKLRIGMVTWRAEHLDTSNSLHRALGKADKDGQVRRVVGKTLSVRIRDKG